MYIYSKREGTTSGFAGSAASKTPARFLLSRGLGLVRVPIILVMIWPVFVLAVKRLRGAGQNPLLCFFILIILAIELNNIILNLSLNCTQVCSIFLRSLNKLFDQYLRDIDLMLAVLILRKFNALSRLNRETAGGRDGR